MYEEVWGEGIPRKRKRRSMGEAKKFMEWEAPQSWLSPLGQTLVCVVTGLKRSMDYNTPWKIYKRRILTLQEKAIFHR